VYARRGKEQIKVWRNGRVADVVTNREIPCRGNPQATIAIVGESPGAEELQQGKCFVGASGRVATEELMKNGIDLSTVFWGNACRCHLNKAELSEKEINKSIDCCRPMIQQLLLKIHPKVIVLFGNIAMKSISKLSGITEKRGKFIWSPLYNCYLFPTYHPAYCLRDNSHFTLWRPDIRQLATFVRNNYKPKIETTKTDYREVDSIAFLLKQKNFIVGIDTETQGTIWANDNFVPISYAVSDEKGKGYVVRLHEEVYSKEQADFAIVWERTVGRKLQTMEIYVRRTDNYEKKIEELKQLCRRSDIQKITFHGNYDRHVLETLGVTEFAGFSFDVQLAAHLYDPEVFRRASLENVQRFLLPDSLDHKHIFTRENKEDMLAADREQFITYAAADPDITRRCAATIIPMLKPMSRVWTYYKNFLHPVTQEVLYDIERNGVYFDLQKLPEVKKQLAEKLKAMSDRCLELAPAAVLQKHEKEGGAEALRLTRGDLIRDILYSKQGFHLTPLALTKGGGMSIDKKQLKQLREMCEPNSPPYEFLSEYLAWSPFKTLYNTYLKGFENSVCSDGKLHPSISTVWTATGRSASHNPNTQNIPKRNPEIAQIIRGLIKATPGYVFLAKDYAGAELRWIAHRSRDPMFLRVYKHNYMGGDIHTVTAKQIAKLARIDWNTLTPEQQKRWRQNAKAINFGYCYGMYPRKFVATARDDYGIIISEEEATRWRESFFSLYQGLEEWHRREIEFARKHKYCETDFGRRRNTPNILSDDFQMRVEDEHVAVNTPIQGDSSDAGLLGCLQAKRAGLLDGTRARLVLFIHDELIWEVREDFVHSFSKEMDGFLTNLPTEQFGFTLRVPLATETTVGYDLGHMEALT